MNLIYNVKDKPKFGQTLIFAFQQVLAILAATIAVPTIIGNGMSQSAALFGAGVGTLVYLLFTRFRSPVFLGSSFAFISSMFAAFGGAVSASIGYFGIIIGAIFAGLVYVIIAVVIKFAGVGWLNKLMPPVIIGPTVAIIGLSLAGNAIGDATGGALNPDGAFVMDLHAILCLICALVTLATVTACSVYGKKMLKLIPFIIGILAGYLVATVFTVIGSVTENAALVIIDFTKFQNMQWIPNFAFVEGFKGLKELIANGELGSYLGVLAMAYMPVAFVVFAEHIADHKNLSSIIGTDLTEDPGLSRTLLGDGVGSMAGAFFGGCPNTTYGESVGCVAISGNASVWTIIYTAIGAILISFLAPFVAFVNSIPSCVMGGICVALYGFIAVSGLKMVQKVDLSQNKNLFTVSVILITGVGGLVLTFGQITLTTTACALILGILTNLMLKSAKETD